MPARLALFFLGLAIAVAGLTVVRATDDGIGEGHDTSHYLSAATNLRNGKGMTVAFSSGFDPVDTATALDHYGRAPHPLSARLPLALAAADLVTPGGLSTRARRRRDRGDASPAAPRCFPGARHHPRRRRHRLGRRVTPSALHLSMWAMSDAPPRSPSRRSPPRRVGPNRATAIVARAAAGVLAAATAATATTAAAVSIACSRSSCSPGAGRRGLGRAAASPTVVVFVTGAIALPAAHQSPPGRGHPPGRDDVAALFDVVGMWTVGAKSRAVIRTTAVVFMPSPLSSAGRALGGRGASVRRMTAHRAIAIAIGVLPWHQLAAIIVTSALLDADVTADRRILVPVELLAVVLVAVCGPAAAGPVTLPVLGAFIVLRSRRAHGALPEASTRPTWAIRRRSCTSSSRTCPPTRCSPPTCPSRSGATRGGHRSSRRLVMTS
jgi:hypothetical protein